MGSDSLWLSLPLWSVGTQTDREALQCPPDLDSCPAVCLGQVL